MDKLFLTLVFLFVCLAFMCFSFIRKSTVFSLICGALWFLFAIYTYSNSIGWDINRGFAMIGTLMAILCWVMPFTWRISPAEVDETPEEYIESINRQREELINMSRKTRRKGELL